MHINPNQSYYYKCDEREIEDTAVLIYFLENTIMEQPLNQGEQKLVDAIKQQGSRGDDLFKGHGKNTDQYIRLNKLLKKQGLDPVTFELNGECVPYSEENTRKLAWKRGTLKAQQMLNGSTIPTPTKPVKPTNTVGQMDERDVPWNLAAMFVTQEMALTAFAEGRMEDAAKAVELANELISESQAVQDLLAEVRTATQDHMI